MRWAKVPEWLLDDLVERAPAGVAPGTALAAWVGLAVRADFRTGRVRATPADLARILHITPRTARRVLDALVDLGAVHRAVDGVLQLADIDVRPDLDGDTDVRTADADVLIPDFHVRNHLVEPAGRTPDLVQPPQSRVLSDEPLHLVEAVEGEQMELSAQRAPKVVDWLADRDSRLQGGIRDEAAGGD